MSSDPNPSDPPRGGTWAERNYHGLKIAVIVMGILLVAGFVLIIVTIATRVSDSSPPRERAPVASALPPDIARLLGPDGEVVSTALDGSRLAIVLKRPEGHAVLVVDLRTGQVTNVVAAE